MPFDRFLCQTLIGVLCTGYAIFIVLRMVRCVPFASQWTPNMPGKKCFFNATWFMFASQAWNMVMDVVILLVPLLVLRHSKAPWPQRVLIGVVLAFGASYVSPPLSVFHAQLIDCCAERVSSPPSVCRPSTRRPPPRIRRGTRSPAPSTASSKSMSALCARRSLRCARCTIACGRPWPRGRREEEPRRATLMRQKDDARLVPSTSPWLRGKRHRWGAVRTERWSWERICEGASRRWGVNQYHWPRVGRWYLRRVAGVLGRTQEKGVTDAISRLGM